jgi:WD40 repeat protein/DNA-binding SARP family transcriptional activator
MRVRVLGPVEASRDGRPVPLGAGKQRALLAMLALQANRTVSADVLLEGLWGERPPASAPKMVQQYVSLLRRSLGDGDNGNALEILTRGRGYELHVAPDEVDAARFERLVADGAAREALALWRGPALADVADEPFAAAEIRRLEELRLTALAQAIDAELADGRHRELVAELEGLVADHPLSEGLHGQLMLALYRSGRQAEALEAYRRARTTLVEQIGVEPGRQLRRLHEAVLGQEAWLDLGGPGELPAELETSSPLVGREAELERLHAAWARARGGAGPVVVVSGPPGIGRTRLVAELAREVQREGARVLDGADPRRVGGPALVVFDDVEAGAAELGEPTPGVLRVVTTADAGLAGRLGAEHIALTPLGTGAVAAIARHYVSAGAEMPVAELAARSGGVPERAHRLAAEWARAEGARRLAAAADHAAADRNGLRRSEQRLASTVVELRVLRERGGARDVEPATIECPYKGLASYDRADSALFFGRERLVAEMVARLVGARLLAIVGPSGSGKSSALRAGLLPELTRGVLPGTEDWAQVLLRPGEHPLRTLEAATAAAEPDRRQLVAVDQFDEAFTLCADEAERAAFVDALVGSAGGSGSVVIVALRAEFYGRCAAYSELATLLGANHVLVGPMSRDELRRVIELPAQRAGLRVEPELVERLLADAEDQPGALPLLSSALLELWQQRDGRHLRLAAYERTGGVRGAVARLAEAAYDHLDLAEQTVARSILLRLAGQDDGAGPVRRRVALEELDADRDDVRAVLDALARSRLVLVDAGTAEVAHEALLREWPRLRGWLEEDADGRRLHHHLALAAREWDDSGRDPGELYRGARLASTLGWSARHAAERNELERAFVEASVAHGEREASRARRATRRLRALLAGAAVLLLVAVVAGVLFLGQRRTARDEARTSVAQRLGAQALVEHDLDRSLLFARQGIAIDDSLQTRSNLLAALLRSPAAIGVMRIPDSRLLRIALRPDGRALVAGDNRGTLDFLEPRSHRALRPSSRPFRHPVLALAFSPDGSRLAVGGQGTVELLDGHTFRRLAAPPVPDVEWANLAFSPDGRELVAAATSTSTAPTRPVPSVLVRFDGRTGRRRGPPRRIAAPGALADVLAFSPDGRRLITAAGGTLFAPETRAIIADGDRAIVVRDARTLRPLRRFPALAYAGAVSPDARTFAIGGQDGSVRFLDLRTGERSTASGRHAGAVQRAVFTPDGRHLVTVGDDANAIVWDVRAARAIETFHGHAGRVLAAAVDRDARTLYTAGLDGSVIVWDLVGDRRLGRTFEAGTGTGDWFPSTAISGDGRSLATLQDGGAVSLVDLSTLRRRSLPIRGAPPLSPAYAPAFGPRGTLVVSGVDGFLALVDARSGRVLARLRGHRDIVFTPTTSADGGIIASTGIDGTLRLWNARAARALGPPIRLGGPPSSEAGISPDGTRVAVSLAAGTIDVFDVRSRRRVARLRVDAGNSTFSGYSRDGRLLLAGSKDGRVRLFRARDLRPLGPAFPAHNGSVSSVDASPDDRTLVTAGSDGQIRLWDLASRRPIGTPLPGPENINAVAFFAPDGKHVFAVFRDGLGYRWDVRATSWDRQACQIAARRLTRVEWNEALPGRTYAPAC